MGKLSPTAPWPRAGPPTLDLPGTILNRGLGIVSLVDGAGKATGGYAYGLVGAKGFFLSGMEQGTAQAGALAFFFFMMALIDKAALIPAGAMVERWRWKNFCLYGLVGRAAADARVRIGSGAAAGWPASDSTGGWATE